MDTYYCILALFIKNGIPQEQGVVPIDKDHTDPFSSAQVNAGSIYYEVDVDGLDSFGGLDLGDELDNVCMYTLFRPAGVFVNENGYIIAVATGGM